MRDYTVVKHSLEALQEEQRLLENPLAESASRLQLLSESIAGPVPTEVAETSYAIMGG
jgi:hypothetical protein